MMKKVKKVSAFALAFALAFSAMVISKTYAALAVDTNRTDCAIEFNVAKNVSTGDIVFEELNQLPVEVNLYKVATIDVAGRCTAVEGFETLGLEEISSETKEAAWWEAKALAAKELLTEETVSDKTVTLYNGSAIAWNLATGMYLVVPEDIKSDTYAYTFKPYLISLPNNYFYATGNDDWDYSLIGNDAIGLKPEATDLYGDLVIEKDLLTYNATVGGATFVFQVEAAKDYAAVGGEVETVYSDVVSITFDAAGKKSVLIENIPAGAEVTVTEVYSGGSYEAAGENEFTTTIIADEVVEAEGRTETVATVTFTNDYSGELNGGSGVVNHFEENGSGNWTWTSSPDSTN